MTTRKITNKLTAPIKKIPLICITIILLSNFVLPFQINVQSNMEFQNDPMNPKNLPQSSHVLGWNPAGLIICNATNAQYRPNVVSDGADGAIIVWQDDRSGMSHIYAQHITGEGIPYWGLDPNGSLICGAPIGQAFPCICEDDAGGAIIAWQDARSGALDIYAQRVDASGLALWSLNGIMICNANKSQTMVHIKSDGTGGAVLVWNDERAGNIDIYAQRVNAAGILQWGPNGTSICNETGAQTLLQSNPLLVSDDAGGMIFSWLDFRTESLESNDIYMQHVNAAGIPQWGSNGKAVFNNLSTTYYIDMTSDGMRGAVIGWSDRRTGNYDIYAQWVNAEGISQWQVNGTLICNTQGNQIETRLISVGTEGTIIIWQDQRIGNDIFGQRINSSGICQWEMNGSVICNSYGDQIKPQIVRDGGTGAIIVWEDYRTGTSDIYVQHIKSDGRTQWGTNGMAICDNNSMKTAPQLSYNNFGGAIIVWEDERDMISTDIYAQSMLNSPPTANSPPDFHTWNGGSDQLQWILQDDERSGIYRVIADSPGGWYVCVNWTSWEDNVPITVPLNRTAFGTFNYTIEYTDGNDNFGVPNTVSITMQCLAICGPGPIVLMTIGAETSILRWIIIDTFSDSPSYQLLRDGSIIRQGTWRTDWELTHSVSDLPLGTYNFTLIASEGTSVVMQDSTTVKIIPVIRDRSDLLTWILSAVIISILSAALTLIIIMQRQLSRIKADFQSFTINEPKLDNEHKK